ncbi:fumarylacetoacetate hydrolase family protein [Rhodococcus sp. USK13]|uniref:fumarylacetoacetate hydrolase family protein n=1 Tax=Rhodococcus sp. USK13 TaxID=2806442 RepID=UPI001BCC4303|nr:fumarylacetoacetate hydrolase family protein [Rhodococcus sp. USK13]
MRLLNVNGRLAIERDGKAIDVERASRGAFGADPADIYLDWDRFRVWEGEYGGTDGESFDPEQLGSPVTTPRQIFAIGLNYRGHAEENDIELPDTPMVFTKFATSITGPNTTVVMPTAAVDWEAELVAVVGRRAERVAAADAWDHIAGLTIGQDLSERVLQVKPPGPQQFSLAKSFPGFAPIGPALVTPDEFDNPGDLEIGCRIGAEVMQKSRTADLIFSVPVIVEYLSSILPLLPGDVIFTGTPDGVGYARTPQRFLRDGEELTTWIEGIGTMTQRFVAKAES